MKDPGTILITGTTGQVGGALAREFPWAQAPTRAQLDLNNPASIRECIRQLRPRWILNPAAYTAVDRAETDAEAAFRINAEAPRILGEEAQRIGAGIIHFSTDYVFDGTKSDPYVESDPTNPLGVYGASKRAGEQALAATGAAHLILRTSWVYAASGKNFLLTILRVARERAEMRIVADQRGAPTSARDLATLTAHLLRNEPESLNQRRIYHATASGDTSWHGFAQEAVRQAQLFEPATQFATLLPIATSEYPTPARRPLNSRLDCTLLATRQGYPLPLWQDGLSRVMAELYPHHTAAV